MLQQPQVMRTHAGSTLDAVQQARKGVPALRSQAAPFRHAQAVADALDPRDTDRTDDLGDALVWFKTVDFEIVCERAGYDAADFRECFREFQLARQLRLGSRLQRSGGGPP